MARPVRFDKGGELTPKEIHTIEAVGVHEGVNVTDLAACCGVTKSAASAMTRAGLVDSRTAASGYHAENAILAAQRAFGT